MESYLRCLQVCLTFTLVVMSCHWGIWSKNLVSNNNILCFVNIRKIWKGPPAAIDLDLGRRREKKERSSQVRTIIDKYSFYRVTDSKTNVCFTVTRYQTAEITFWVQRGNKRDVFYLFFLLFNSLKIILIENNNNNNIFLAHEICTSRNNGSHSTDEQLQDANTLKWAWLDQNQFDSFNSNLIGSSLHFKKLNSICT